ncbi:ATP-binding protein [Testudinibacter sp. TR-2022]|uniref:AAA family ATPase n=1 Tax=Testudinibacter sp. TR-2022 TaxID=2585029 RepID=UPI0011192195|nr:ATP-binding protein [Testudinibacter sp. TR-2022]TNH05577.1 ATP-binding protein [Pasteurellaceae bacterium Phil31]TNH08034.1 ATP-binding protein [Testudinibacter sp. TR-2022]TNH09522.1 ATP-binding protein [Testudinibacter sp. TR-2022]TNH11016.1 ATP-binding protein [Testudinibacter sp. TR-2022]TNH15383.1 ATP-binding protein [Testudinibacter sp. TR-2022]
MKVKSSAIIYTGYDYQTLQGVKLLAEWLHSPTKYVRMVFEADTDGNETPEGIDDIVCERPDGVRDYWQVKFTPSPEKDENCLTWDWLLKISGNTARSRSILKKLYDAISAVPAEKLGDVILLTNKRPDRSIESCLLGSKVDFSQIHNDLQLEIIHQLGNKEAAIFLFSKLSIQHSDGDYLAIKRSVRSELLKFSDDTGVERLVARAREWAMFKDNPPEHGWIYLHHIREVLSPKRPESIPELFSVPDDYCLPNSDFHNELLAKINRSNGEVITLTGKPGTGKSTYLSFLCQELEEQEVPLIRHHYFLSLGDTTEDRLSPRIVAESLLHQIDSFHKESNANTSQPENLRDALSTCATYYKGKGKPFVVLIDGLDHVWRDNAKNKNPLDETFRQLLPTTDNLVVLVGTQPVDDELLPNTLLTYSPKNKWHWLPEMSGNSIYEFLKIHIESGRLFLNCHENQIDEEIQNSAGVLLEITNGYPLHIIYSSEYLSHHGLALSAWQIEKLPPCSDGNITTYYSELWRNLNYRQKDVLHLCSGFQFAWPRQAIGVVIRDNHEYAPSVDAVAHMLSEGICGIRPFHESLVVFVRNQKEHQERINSLLPPVCEWLSSSAPTHLKDNWLWSSLARGGDSFKLRQGVTRDWVLDRLIIGMPVRACIRLLSEAETYAFQELDYAEAYRHRALKTRLINGPEFQTWDSTNLKMLSLLIADEQSLNEIISGQNEYSPTKLSILAIALWYRGATAQAELLSQKAIDRYRAKTKLLSSRHSQDNEVEATTLIKAGVLTDSLNFDAIFEEGKFSNWPDEYVASFRRACRIKKEFDLLFRARQCLFPASNHIGQIELDVIRLSILEGAGITCRQEYGSFSSQHLSQFIDIFSKKIFTNIRTHYFHGQSSKAFKVDVASSYHCWFFSSLCIRLNAKGDYSWLPVSATADRVSVSAHYDLINELADLVANELIAGNTLNFDVVCAMFPRIPILDETQWETRRAEIDLKRAWIEIAADCHLITTKSEISRGELKHTIEDGLFRVDWLRLWYKDAGLKLLDDAAAELLIELEDNRQLNELEQTIEHSNAYLELAKIAFQHDNLALFKKYLRKTWDFVLGYGYHKDSTIFDVLKAVEYLSESDPSSALVILERISPIVFNISEFTDGDETRHSKRSISSLLAKLNPQTAASVYEQELSDGEWYYAEETIYRLLERCNFASPITKCLYLTGLHSSCYQVLRKKIEKGEPHAICIADEIENLLGINVRNTVEEKQPSVNELDETISLQPSDYPPEKFEELIEALKGKYSTRKFWKGWYKYWCTHDKELELLQQLIPKMSTFIDRFDDKRYLLDLLFFSVKKLNGKTKAFDILVAAHKAMSGWSDWYERSKNSLNRLTMVAGLYPKKIDEFIRLTTSQSDTWENKFGNLIIPNDKLVFLLSHGGRKDEALKLMLEMVTSLEESVRNLPLAKPVWDWRQNSSLEEAILKTLVSRLKLPIPSIKLWVIEQLSRLLIVQHPRVEELLKEDLASRKQESESVEVLCVFFIAKSKGYACPNDLGHYIKARSTLSDLILTELVPTSKDFGKYVYPSTSFVSLTPNNNRFEYYQGNHVPLVYYSLLQEEAQRTCLPFTAHYQNEWNNTFEYQPSAATTIDYFFNADRQRSTGQFYTQASHRGRSAYLRTIDLAKEFYGMPDSYAEYLSIPALPIEPAYTDLQPQKPKWLPAWNSQNSPNEANLINYVKEGLSNFTQTDDSNDLLAFSLPIRIDSNNWIDLTVVKVSTGIDLTPDMQVTECYGCFAVGNLLDKGLFYKFYDGHIPETPTMAGTSYPSMRYGHWHSDLTSRGFYIPKCTIDGKKMVGSSSDGLFSYSIDGSQVGFSSFWYNDWQPIHPIGIRSFCGSYTVVSKERIGQWHDLSEVECNSCYLCKAILLTSEDSFREFNKQEIEFFIR